MQQLLRTLLMLPFITHAQPGEWPVVRLQEDIPAHRMLNNTEPVHSILYQGEPIRGQSTEIFAFYASPSTLGNDEAPRPYPGIVLIHGGGGTAFANWALDWAERGYAALAMDLSGHQPPSPAYDEHGKIADAYQWHDQSERTPLKNGSLPGYHQDKFDSIRTLTTDDDWPYHAVANVMRGHTLLRSFEEVDAERTAVTGISWGGYTTCIVASIDERFKAAVPVYGCGFLWESDSVQRKPIDELGTFRQQWIDAYCPSSHLSKCKVPTLWVNGTHDEHYPLDAFIRSSQLVSGPRAYRIEVQMPHNHIDGWSRPEIARFIDSILNNKRSLPEILSVETTQQGTVTADVQSPYPIVKAQIHYTTDTGLGTERKWHDLPMTLRAGKVTAHDLPADASAWFINITDESGAIISSQPRFLEPLSDNH